MFGLQNDLSMLGIVNTIHEHIDFLGVKMILHPCMAMRGTRVQQLAIPTWARQLVSCLGASAKSIMH